jgi:pyruvate formate lyase activating enzyme
MIGKRTPCALCGQMHPLMADALKFCPRCALREESIPLAKRAHIKSRELFNLPVSAPRTACGISCNLCANACLIGEGERGFCGLKRVQDGRLEHIAGTAKSGLLHWYRDPLPTNCVADWICAGSSQRGKHNLAVFYASCTLDCLFCQNWHFREVDHTQNKTLSSQELADCANPRTFCVCYFGGDPASQMAHALTSGRTLAKNGVTVCWETAGTANTQLMERALKLSLDSGGCVKFDLKAFTEPLHIALTGASNHQTLENFAHAASRSRERQKPPLVIASSLLVPGYVDAQEVGKIAAFIAQHDRDTPYALLGFSPNYLMPDLPRTSKNHAEAAQKAAQDAGLSNVRIGNRHLLSWDYGKI